MNKKVYIKPNSKQTVISNESLLADSDLGPETFEKPTPEEEGEAGTKLFNWNGFDEF